MEIIRVLVVDDSVTIRAMIETLLERDEDLRVVGIARNADEALDLIAATDPDVITLDIAMPGRNGMEILDHIMANDPRPVIMLSSLLREGDPLIDTALSHGAKACFNKTKIVQEANRLIVTIKEVAAEWAEMREAAEAAAQDSPQN